VCAPRNLAAVTEPKDPAADRPRRRAERLLGAAADPVETGPPRARPETPAAVRWAALVVGVEAAALVVGAGAMVVLALTGHVAGVGNAFALAVSLLLLGLFLGAVAGGLWRVARWARSAAVAIQIILGLMGLTAISQAHSPAFGIPVLALVALEFYLLATPEARLVFFNRREGD
jgi:hypothetical protein